MPADIGRRAAFSHARGASHVCVALRACIGSAKLANDCETPNAHRVKGHAIIFSPRDARMKEWVARRVVKSEHLTCKPVVPEWRVTTRARSSSVDTGRA
ncbi:hypothetical protein [Paraburkholderia sp. BL27I4N3]|uniref:hypothetical protein n=1 Tax=Paraburkholderia sp. BL27I4N3 TaxID=1938805 RepID=UPI000E22967B|nr:hypothetical protein [Paraburkholderia sp. BL27I4N3]